MSRSLKLAIELPKDEGGGCAFCKAISQAEFIVASSRGSVCFVPERAGTEGSLLVVTRRHAATFLELTTSESLDLLALGKRSALALLASFSLEAFNFWWDTGVLSGQQHLHVAIEILPRKEGDGHVFVKLNDRPMLSPVNRRAIALRVREFVASATDGGSRE